MNKLNKLALAALVAASSFSAFAEGETSADFAGELGATAIGAIDGALIAITPVLVAAFGITVAFLAYKLIKRAVNKA